MQDKIVREAGDSDPPVPSHLLAVLLDLKKVCVLCIVYCVYCVLFFGFFLFYFLAKFFVQVFFF